MKVSLVYDEPVAAGAAMDGLPDDIGREFEDADTVAALLDAIAVCGHEPAKVPLDADFFVRIRDAKPDLVFNISEGLRGRAREAMVPAWLDHLGIPCTGSDGLTLAISLDKALTKELAAAHGVRTPPFRRVSGMADLAGFDVPFPVFVKPNAEGSNMGVWASSLVRDVEELSVRVERILTNYGDCLVERFAPGRELCVGLLGNGAVDVLAVAEVCIDDGFYAQAEAPLRHKKMLCPVSVPAETIDDMVRMTKTVFEVLRCRDLMRADFMLDDEGLPTFLEANPLPSLSPAKAVYPLQSKVSGLGYEELIGRVIDAALARG